MSIKALDVVKRLAKLESTLIGFSRTNPHLYKVVQRDVVDLQRKIITAITDSTEHDTLVELSTEIDILKEVVDVPPSASETETQKEEGTETPQSPDAGNSVAGADGKTPDGQQSQTTPNKLKMPLTKK